MPILVVEADSLLRHHLCYQLKGLGHQVLESSQAAQGVELATEQPLDAAIVDLALAEESGLELIRTLRLQGHGCPILILTDRGSWQDKVQGLDAGADDYVVKPFQFDELDARLNTLLRRHSNLSQPEIRSGNLRLDLTSKQAFVDDLATSLTAFEYKILEYLMCHHQQVVAKERLIEQLYQNESGRDSNVLEVLVARLRKKLERATGYNPIATIRGQGYMFNRLCR